MDLENLVEKITREVMDTLKQKQAPSSNAYTPVAPSNPAPISGGMAVLLCGSPHIGSDIIGNAISHLRRMNYQVTVALAPGAPTITTEGATVIRCGYINDCSASIRNCALTVILLSDIATASRLSNLICDRFDIEGAISALEAGKEVWGLNVMADVSPKLSAKVNNFIKEIESYGIKVTRANGVNAVPSVSTSFKSVPVETKTALYCTQQAVGECAGCGLCSQLITDQVKNVVDSGAERVSAAPGVRSVDREIAKMIDHTLLKADATKEQIIKLCEEARKYSFASCCINPAHVKLAAECLKGSPVKTCTVIGFPLGATTSMIKAMETRDAIADGADEIDMVINVGALKAGDYDLVRRDIESVVNAARGKIVKVIIEAALLTNEEKVVACQLAKQAGADFVKTSTGFGPGGATVDDIALMRQTVGKYMGVKASGGIRDYEQASAMVKAGATRIGASASVGIVKGEKAKAGSGY